MELEMEIKIACDQFQLNIMNTSNSNICKNCQQPKSEHQYHSSSKKGSFCKSEINLGGFQNNTPVHQGRMSIRETQEQLSKNLNTKVEKKSDMEQELEQIRQMMKGGFQDIIGKLGSGNSEQMMQDMNYATAQELEKLKQHINGNIKLKQSEIKEMQDHWEQQKMRDKKSVGKLDDKLTQRYTTSTNNYIGKPPKANHKQNQSLCGNLFMNKQISSTNASRSDLYKQSDLSHQDRCFLQEELLQFKDNVQNRIDDLQNDLTLDYDLQQQVSQALSMLKEMSNLNA